MEWIKINERKPTREELKTEQIFVWIPVAGNSVGLCWEAEYNRTTDRWKKIGEHYNIRENKVTHWGIPTPPMQ
jgi:hypothetical protein